VGHLTVSCVSYIFAENDKVFLHVIIQQLSYFKIAFCQMLIYDIGFSN